MVLHVQVLDGEKFDSEVFQKGLRDKIATSGVSAFFPANSTFLNDVIAKADTFARQGTSALASPEYLPGLSHLSLYQPIIFCGKLTNTPPHAIVIIKEN